MIKALIANAESLDIDAQDILSITQNKTAVVAYHLLGGYSSIDALLQPHGSVVILWEVEGEWKGHFTCLYFDASQLHYFDSYGMSPSKDKDHSTWDLEMGTPNYLQRLLDAYEPGYTQNTVDYQQWSGDVNTCGRWTGLRIRTRLTVSAQRFEQLFHAANGDMWVSAITLLDTTRL